MNRRFCYARSGNCDGAAVELTHADMNAQAISLRGPGYREREGAGKEEEEEEVR